MDTLCLRCEGLLVEDIILHEAMIFLAMRCINCGNFIFESPPTEEERASGRRWKRD